MSDDRKQIEDRIQAEFEPNLTPEDEKLLEDIVMDLPPAAAPGSEIPTVKAMGIHKGPEQSDPGPDKYNPGREDSKRKLMAQCAFYDEDGPTFDPEGKYLCGTCYYRQLMDWGDTPACYIVDGKISMETGTCFFYRNGNPDSEWNPLPSHHRYSKEEAGYAESPKKGFGCYPRCEYADPAEGKDRDGREFWCRNWGVHVRAKACCAFEEHEGMKTHFVQIESGGAGSGCNPDVAEEHGTKCGPKAGPEKDTGWESTVSPAEFYLKEKIGEQKGSNPGGVYKDAVGNSRYVKFYDDPKQARGEFLANKIYSSLSVTVPSSQLFEKDGKPVYSHHLMDGQTVKQIGQITENQAKAFMNGAAADILTANWDAVGTGKDNVFIGNNGVVYRLDQGGTFLKRAQGSDKPENVLNQITEAKNLFDPGINKHYADVAKMAGVKSLADLGEKTGTDSLYSQVKDILALRDKFGSWANYVDSKVPSMPDDEKKKIVGMLEARTNLLENLALETNKKTSEEEAKPEEKVPSWAIPKPDAYKTVTNDPAAQDAGKKYTPRTWGDPNPKLVGGYFRSGTVLANVYGTLAKTEGQWQSISSIKSDLEKQLGKNLYNISQNTLKQGGKKTGLWSVEVSGDSIRLFINKQGEKPKVDDVTDDKQKIAEKYAKMMYDKSKDGSLTNASSEKYHYDFLNQMNAPSGSQLALNSAVRGWTGDNNSPNAQNWRQVAMEYYGRNPSGEYVGSYPKVIGTPKGSENAEKMKPAAMALKAMSSEFAKLNNVNVVYRNIGGQQARDIVTAMRAAEKDGKTKIAIANNSLSCWSDRVGMSLTNTVKIRMKVDPDNVWATHTASPHLFSAHPGEREYMIGTHNPVEVFDFKDITIQDKYSSGVTSDEYNKWHKEWKQGEMSAQKDTEQKSTDVSLDPKADQDWYEHTYLNRKSQLEGSDDVYWGMIIGPLDDHWMYRKAEK